MAGILVYLHLACSHVLYLPCSTVIHQCLFITWTISYSGAVLLSVDLVLSLLLTCSVPVLLTCSVPCTVHLPWTCKVHLFCTWTVHYFCLDYSSVLYLGCHLFCSWTVHLFWFSTVHLFCICAMLFIYTCTVQLYLYCSPVMNLYCSPVLVLLTCYEPVYEALFACGCFPVLTVGEGKNLTPAGLQGGCEPFRGNSAR